jgi:hypothetical protein
MTDIITIELPQLLKETITYTLEKHSSALEATKGYAGQSRMERFARHGIAEMVRVQTNAVGFTREQWEIIRHNLGIFAKNFPIRDMAMLAAHIIAKIDEVISPEILENATEEEKAGVKEIEKYVNMLIAKSE